MKYWKRINKSDRKRRALFIKQKRKNHEDFLKKLENIGNPMTRFGMQFSYQIDESAFNLLSKGFQTGYSKSRKILTLPPY